MPASRKYASSAERQAAYRARRKARVEQPPGMPATGSVYHRWLAMRKQAASLLEGVAREMETYHTQRSEAWRDSERGEAFISDGRPHCYFLASAMTVGGNLERLAQALIGDHPHGQNLTPADMPTLWSILQFYGEMAREHRFALVLDEFQYLVEADPSIPSQIQAWWDTAGLRSQAYVVVCGHMWG